MSNRFVLPLFTAGLLGAMVAFSGTATAQVLFSVDVHDSTAVLREGQVIELKATIRNEGFMAVTVRAVRLENELPGEEGWYTAMCFGDQCYPPDMDISPGAKIEPGDTALFKLSVGTANETYGTGTVRARIRFDTGVLSDGVEQEFTVMFDGTSAAPNDDGRTVRLAFPNPARTSAIVPVEPSDLSAQSLRVQLVDALGRTVVDLRDAVPTADGVRVDVSGVADGAYFYRVDADGATRTGRIVVAH